MPYLLSGFWPNIERQCLQHPLPLIRQISLPCDFWLFAKLKSALKGTHFESVEKLCKNKIDRGIEGIARKGFPTSFQPMGNTDGAMCGT